MTSRLGPPATIVFIAISVGVFILDYLTGHRLIEWGAKSHLVWAGEWHRLITANFIHSGIPHLLLDMYALFIFGTLVESVGGLSRYIAVYLLGGAAGFALSLLASPAAPSVGSSAAIFALMGYAVHHRIRNLPLRLLPIDSSLGQILGINLALGIFIPNIDQFAHLGGLIGGLLCGMLLGPVYSDRQYWEIAPQRRRPVERTAAALVLLVLISAGLNPMRAAGWLRPVVPAAAEAMEARYGRFFTPFVATNPAVLWVDPDLPDSYWRFVESTLSLPDGPPVAFGVFWRWTRGGGAEEQSTYRVVWERRPHAGEAWTYVGEETGGVDQIDEDRDFIYRRSMIVVRRAETLYGEWRVQVDVDGIRQYEREYAVTQ